MPTENHNKQENFSESAVYRIRNLICAIPWGEGPNDLPYKLTDMGGGPDAIAPADMIALSSSTFVLRDPITGSVYIADIVNGTTSKVDLSQVAAHLNSSYVVSFSVTTTHVGEIAVLAGGSRVGSNKFAYALCFFKATGSLRHCISLPTLSDVPDSPRGLGVSDSGNVWVIYGPQAIVFDAKGNQLKTVNSPGVLTPGGLYFASGHPPKLYTEQGDALGAIESPETPGPIRFVGAGAGNTLLALCDTAPIPDRLGEKLDIFDVFVFDADNQKLELHDRVVWPTMVLDVPPDNPDADGLPVKSYFPPESACFDSKGDLYIIEHTPMECRFHVYHRLSGTGDEWKQKFMNPMDLSSAEIELYSAECLARLGFWEEAGALAAFFKPTRWAKDVRRPNDPQHLKMQDPALRAIKQARPAIARDGVRRP